MADLNIYSKVSENEKRYVVFSLNKELFGIDVTNVEGIIQMASITKVPRSPHYYEGVINLRGEVIPIMSLNSRFGYGDDEITANSRIINVDIGGGRFVGVIVDNVKEVLTVSEDRIEEQNALVNKENSFVSGIIKMEDRLISILELDSLFFNKVA